MCTWKTGKWKIGQYTGFDLLTSISQRGKCAEEKVAKHRQMMIFFRSHLNHNIFNYCMRRFFFGLVYMYPMKITKYCTLQWFQICINHNILITNKRLEYMGVKNDPLCTFCKTRVETTVRLLWDCSITKKISWLRSFHIHIELSEKLFLFGLEKEKKYQMPVNLFYCM